VTASSGPSATAAAVTDGVARALARLDRKAVRGAYLRQNEFVHLPGCLPAPLIDALVAESQAVRPAIHRAYIPRHKKGGSVSAYTLVERAPAIQALYRAPALVEFLAAVTGRSLFACPPRDPHACALYFYTEPGDHIGFHYDTSYYRGERFTVLVGLVERSSSRLVCQLYRDIPGRETVEVRLATDPGAVVIFNGDKLWHAITPLGEGEERVSLTLEYVTDPSMSPLRRVVSNLKDAIGYFGLRTVLLGPRRKASPRA
jgi:hypothetical protein